jgi:hypothetical protein
VVKAPVTKETLSRFLSAGAEDSLFIRICRIRVNGEAACQGPAKPDICIGGGCDDSSALPELPSGLYLLQSLVRPESEWVASGSECWILAVPEGSFQKIDAEFRGAESQLLQTLGDRRGEEVRGLLRAYLQSEWAGMR